MESKIFNIFNISIFSICDMSARGFLIEILLRRYNAERTEVISGFLFTFINQRLREHLVETFTVP